MPSFESADPRDQLAVIVAQEAELRRTCGGETAPFDYAQDKSELLDLGLAAIEQACRISSLLWEDTEVS